MSNVLSFTLFVGLLFALVKIVVATWANSTHYVNERGNALGLSQNSQNVWRRVTRVLGPIGRLMFVFWNPEDKSRFYSREQEYDYSSEAYTVGDDDFDSSLTLLPEADVALRVIQKSGPSNVELGQIMKLSDGTNVIGRQPFPESDSTQIKLEGDRAISSEHLEIIVLPNGEMQATDLSRFGTEHQGVNMQAKEAVPCNLNDTFKLGNTLVQLVNPDNLSPDVVKLNTPLYRFVVVGGANDGANYDMFDQEFVIGRSSQADWRITADTLSRRHARIWLDREVLRIQDLGSRAGLIVDGRMVKRGQLKDRSKLFLGKTEIQVQKL